MKMEETFKYVDHIVRVTCVDGDIVEGYMWPPISAYDSGDNVDEIELYTGYSCILIHLDEVEKNRYYHLR